MTFPYLLCAGACAAAALAAYIGHHASPDRRRALAKRRVQEAVCRYWAGRFEETRLRVEGQFAVHPGLWITFWYEHELDTLDAPSGGA